MSYIFCVLLCVGGGIGGGMFFLLSGISAAVGMYQLRHNHEIANAIVESIQIRSRGSNIVFYRFYIDDIVYRNHADFLSSRFRVGMEVPIYFNPNNPEGAIIPVQWVERNGFPLFTGGLRILSSLFLLVPFLFLVYNAMREYKLKTHRK